MVTYDNRALCGVNREPVNYFSLPWYKEMNQSYEFIAPTQGQYDMSNMTGNTNIGRKYCDGYSGLCLFFLLLCFFVGIGYFICKFNKPRVCGNSKPRDMRCDIPESENSPEEMSSEELRKRASQTYINSPSFNASSGINNSMGRLPFTPNIGEPSAEEVIGTRAMAGGAPYQAGAFAPSDASAEFYATFQPSNLSSMMPANWRTNSQKCAGVSDAQSGDAPVKANFDEFSRYTVSPSQVKKAETLRGTIRLAELTSTRNSRTLGAPSLLRNAVTPLSPIPNGSDIFIFNDSSIRQGHIAAATGRYPEDISC
jgi:hypothetical protein